MACVAGLRGFCASWLMGGIGACPLVSGAGSCSSDVWGFRWVGLHYHPVDCLAWGILALEAEGYWVGSGLGITMAASRTAHTSEYSPVLLPPVFLSYATVIPNSPRDPPGQAGRSGPLSCEATAFSPGAWSSWDLVCPLRVLFASSSPVAFLWWRPTDLRSQVLWGLLLLMPDPQTGKPDVGLRILTPVGEPLWYCFPVCGSPTWWVCDLIVS